MFQILISIALVLSALIGAPCYGLESDASQPLSIVADRYKLNFKTGISIYTGHVIVEQGTTRLTADVLTVYINSARHIEYAKATGHPSTYHTVLALHDPPLLAQADTIEYYPQKHMVILIGNAKVVRDKSSVTGSRLEYDTKEKTVYAPEARTGLTRIVVY